jgi:hypothetical protein
MFPLIVFFGVGAASFAFFESGALGGVVAGLMVATIVFGLFMGLFSSIPGESHQAQLFVLFAFLAITSWSMHRRYLYPSRSRPMSRGRATIYGWVTAVFVVISLIHAVHEFGIDQWYCKTHFDAQAAERCKPR